MVNAIVENVNVLNHGADHHVIVELRMIHVYHPTEVKFVPVTVNAFADNASVLQLTKEDILENIAKNAQ